MGAAAELDVKGMLTDLGKMPPAPPSNAPTMGRLQKVSYTHDALIDLIIEHPEKSQNEYAAHFGYTPGWISNILASDAFKTRLAARREQIVDPALKATVAERMEALYIQSMNVLMKKLESSQVSDTLALRAAELGARGMGFGQPQVAPAPPESGVARLERLADRLVTLQGNIRKGVTYEGKVEDAAPVQERGAGEVQRLQPVAAQPALGAGEVQADGRGAGGAAQENGGVLNGQR